MLPTSTIHRIALIGVLGVAMAGGGYYSISQYSKRIREDVQKEQVIRDYEGQQRIQERASRAPRSTGVDDAIAGMRDYLATQ